MKRKPLLIASLVAVTFGMTACAGQSPTKSPPSQGAKADPAAGVPEIRPGFLAGYLPADAVPDSLKLLPPPPAPGSAAMAQDEAAAKSAFSLRGTPRWELATRDADLLFPQAASIYTCALGVEINQEETPHTYVMLNRLRTDGAIVPNKAKVHYQRTRPFVAHGQDVCTPNDRKALEGDGSYPSGHTSIGWIWALVLAELVPERADAIFARGRSYGESRMICNAHWNSDVIGGRHLASTVVAKLHVEPAFQRDVALAKSEIATQRAKGKPLPSHCAAEAAALATVLAVPPL